MSRHALALTLISLPALLFVNAGTVGYLGSCSTQNNVLQIGTYQFDSDCNSQTYCASNGTCLKRGCRRDDFPFGYSQDDPGTPDKCPRGQFCPDEMDACQDLLPVDSPCQFNRDDQCQAPPNFRELTDTSNRGSNVNGSVCLKNQCMWANKTAGDDCIVENTAYIAYGSDGEFVDVVSRGNCRVGLYCDAGSSKCMNERNIGESCTADKECNTWNCQADGTCGEPAEAPRHLGAWVYAVVAVAIFGGLFGVLFGLFFVHRKQRDTEREQRLQYWREQNAFHQNLMQMREAARHSILSLPNNGGSARSSYITDESGTGFLAPAGGGGTNNKGSSGLRNYMSDDGSSEYEDAPPRREEPGRF